MRRIHMNHCTECHKAIEVNNLDYCESCRIILGIPSGEYRENETQPDIVEEIKEAYRVYTDSLSTSF